MTCNMETNLKRQDSEQLNSRLSSIQHIASQMTSPELTKCGADATMHTHRHCSKQDLSATLINCACDDKDMRALHSESMHSESVYSESVHSESVHSESVHSEFVHSESGGNQVMGPGLMHTGMPCTVR